jgi:hypothetical protein
MQMKNAGPALTEIHSVTTKNLKPKSRTLRLKLLAGARSAMLKGNLGPISLRQTTKFGEVKVDAFSQQRVLELRQEIASLQRDNESFRWQKRHTASEDNTNELRRFRLLAIKEELLRMAEPPSRGKR